MQTGTKLAGLAAALVSFVCTASAARAESDESTSLWKHPSPDRFDVQPYSGWADTDASMGYRVPLWLGDVSVHVVFLVGVTMAASGAESRHAFEDGVGANSSFGLGLGPRAAAPHIGIAIDVGPVRLGYKVVVDRLDITQSMHMAYVSFPF